MHVLNHSGSVYGDDDVSLIQIKAFCSIKVRESSWPSG